MYYVLEESLLINTFYDVCGITILQVFLEQLKREDSLTPISKAERFFVPCDLYVPGNAFAISSSGDQKEMYNAFHFLAYDIWPKRIEIIFDNTLYSHQDVEVPNLYPLRSHNRRQGG